VQTIQKKKSRDNDFMISTYVAWESSLVGIDHACKHKNETENGVMDKLTLMRSFLSRFSCFFSLVPFFCSFSCVCLVFPIRRDRLYTSACAALSNISL
jgi:hypothetical protein